VHGPYDIAEWNNKIVFHSYSVDTDTIVNGQYRIYQLIKTYDSCGVDTMASLNSERVQLKVVDNELYAHGWFSKINDEPCRGLAKYHGVDWECLDPPFGYGGPNVADICLFDNKLWVGGNFSNEQSQPFNEIAYLDLT